MISPTHRERLAAGAALALIATPALAQTSGAGGDLGAFIEQLLDLNTRERPAPERHPHQVLVLLDEFARLGRAEVIARGFAYVAGYGLRLLPVLQSPAQLRADYGPDLAEEIIANCAVEVVFAPKELRLAKDLSERLGDTTVRSPSRSRPTGLSRGHRSLSESDPSAARCCCPRN
jgi:type IV secretion system protein VirD4